MGPLTARFAGAQCDQMLHAQSRTVFMGENNLLMGVWSETSRNNAGTLVQALPQQWHPGHPADS